MKLVLALRVFCIDGQREILLLQSLRLRTEARPHFRGAEGVHLGSPFLREPKPRLSKNFLQKYRDKWLGYLDSNQEQLNQNQPCCQLHHTPPVTTEIWADRQQYLTVTRSPGRSLRVREATTQSPIRSRLIAAAVRAPKPAAIIICVGPGATESPAAYTPGTLVRPSESTVMWPSPSVSMPSPAA